mgnify:CR=1 FL=1
MKYNTEEKKLVMPEYGRNIQNMVDYCITIQDREERKRCADTIINIMGNMFPHLRDVNDFKHILWDHLAIMADFKLDIDYPYEIVKKEDLYSRPPRIPYNNSRIRYRHYGKTLEKMIQKATEFEPGVEKDQLIKLLATQMKKSFLTWNKESVDDPNCRKVRSSWMKRYISWRKAVIYSLATIRTTRKTIHVKADEFICHRRRLPVVR